MNQLFLFGKNMTPIRKLLLMKMFAGGVPISEYTATGNPLTFNTNVAKPLKSLTIPWTPTQTGSGDPSPTNVRPISGVSSVTVWRTGKNLFDGEYPEIVSAPLYYRAIYVGKETVTVSSDIVKTGTSNYSNLFALAGNVSTGAATGINDVREDVSRTITPINGYITLAYRSFEEVDPRDYHTQIEVGSTSTTYTPYTGTTKSIVFPDEVGTVYGGSLDVVSGVLTVTHRTQLLDDADAWNDGETFISYTGHEMNDRKTGNSYGFVCSCFPAEQKSSGTAYIRWDGTTSKNILIAKNGSELTLADVKTLSSNGDIIICYELAEAQTVQLSAQQLSALLGDNVIWSDTNGTNTAVYLKKG